DGDPGRGRSVPGIGDLRSGERLPGPDQPADRFGGQPQPGHGLLGDQRVRRRGVVRQLAGHLDGGRSEVPLESGAEFYPAQITAGAEEVAIGNRADTVEVEECLRRHVRGGDLRPTLAALLADRVHQVRLAGVRWRAGRYGGVQVERAVQFEDGATTQ